MAKDFIGDGLKKFLLVGIGAAAVDTVDTDYT